MPDPERGGSGLVHLALTAAQLPRALPWKSPVLWLIVAVNVALIALSFWSRGGAATDVRIEAIGPHYKVLVDGKLIGSGDFPDHVGGGIGFRLKRNDHTASAAQPVGIDSVRVTNAGGHVLFDDNFDGAAKPAWHEVNGHWETKDGVLQTDTAGLITVGSTQWTSYTVDAKLRNLEDVNMFVWMADQKNKLEVDLSFFRSYRGYVAEYRSGNLEDSFSTPPFEMDRGETIRGIASMMLRPYPTMLLLVLLTGAFALAARSMLGLRVEERLQSTGRWLIRSSSLLVALLAGWAFALLWYILFFVSADMPHVPDSVLYVFQAKIFASFRLTAPAPPVRESFSIFRPHMDQVIGGRWFSHYPFGHPMFLAVGELVHAPSLVPPLLGAACVGLIYLIGRRVYGATVGLLAAVLLAFSPFFQMTASNYMSHNTAAFVILMSLAFYTWRTPRRWAVMFASGIFAGLLFNVRPLTSVAYMIPLGAFMAYEFVRDGHRRARVPEYVAFAAGAIVMFGLYLLYNKATTGQFFESAYAAQGTYSEDTFGFGGAHSVAFGLQNERQLLGLMQIVADGWPAYIGMGIAALPFLLGTRHRWDYVLGATFLAMASANIFYKSPAVMNGPRFWYETMPFLMLLTARGAFYLRDAAVSAAEWIGARLSAKPAAPTTAMTGTAVLGLMTGLIIFSASGWMLELRDGWSGVPFTPTNIAGLRGFNFSDDRLLKRADKQHLHNALVLVQECSGWWCFGSEFWTNSPTLDNDVVWASQQNDSDDIKLLDHYPKRKLYLASYNDDTIKPTTREEITTMAATTNVGPGA